MRVGSAGTGKARTEAGFTLVEVLVATVILATALIALSTLFVGTGVGTFKGTTDLYVKVGRASCESFKVPLSMLAGLRYTYSAGSSTLTDNFGLTWYRYPAVASRHVAGNFVGSAGSPVVTGMMLFEVDAAPTGALWSSWYTYNNMSGPAESLGARSQATVQASSVWPLLSGTARERWLQPSAPRFPSSGWKRIERKNSSSSSPAALKKSPSG